MNNVREATVRIARNFRAALRVAYSSGYWPLHASIRGMPMGHLAQQPKQQPALAEMDHLLQRFQQIRATS